MVTKKEDSGTTEQKQGEAAPTTDPAVAVDADAIKQASGAAMKGESGNQEDWRDRYADKKGKK